MEPVVTALRAESQRLYDKVSILPEAEWDRPSPCRPWTVRELMAHMTAGVGRVAAMLAEPEGAADRLVSAAGYYAPDARFSVRANALRTESAQEGAASHPDGWALAEHFDSVWRAVVAGCDGLPPGRLVRTRHGDPMALGDFLVTRVVEVCVHGFDLAEGLGDEPWPTDEAADVVARLLLDGRPYAVGASVPGMDWDRTTFLRKATGRLPMSAAERAAVQRHGVVRLTLG
ncbi:maleylpyruvate isomerase N-terminal domain-containing protein [Streptomyces sannanensis]